jgi:exonuclease III
MDRRFGTWNARSLNRSGSLRAAARGLARYKLDLVSVQEVRCDKGGTVREGDYNFFFMEKENKSSIWNRIFCTPQTGMAVK